MNDPERGQRVGRGQLYPSPCFWMAQKYPQSNTDIMQKMRSVKFTKKQKTVAYGMQTE